MIFNASNRIAEAFDRHGVKYFIRELDEASIVEAGFPVDGGPFVIARFISKGQENDVALRVFELIHKVPENKRAAVMEACSTLSAKVRFFKFYLDPSANVNMEADLPQTVSDECVGECCFELFVRCMQILDAEYHILAEALYGTAGSGKPDLLELLEALRALRENPLAAPDAESA